MNSGKSQEGGSGSDDGYKDLSDIKTVKINYSFVSVSVSYFSEGLRAFASHPLNFGEVFFIYSFNFCY